MIGRKREIALLKKYENSVEPEFIVVYGRRRVGKTYLIKELFEDRFFFYATGVLKANMAEQLKQFEESLREFGIENKDGVNIDTWMKAFELLKNGIKKAGNQQRKVIFIDEMPWMDTPKSGFLTALDYFWNGFASSRKDVLLIACGSATSWMTKKVLMDTGGLHNRVTGKIGLKPFNLSECEQYFESRNIVIDRRDIVESHMVFGGIPYYLRYWEGMYSVAQNVDMMVFYENAPLNNEFNALYSSLFKNKESVITVVQALAKKKKGLTREELIAATKMADGGTLTGILSDLELSGFIRKYAVFPGKTRGSLYQLTDPFSLFYFSFIHGNLGRNEHFWCDLLETPSLNTWRGYAFEQVCLRHIDEIKAALGVSSVGMSVFAWKSEKSSPGAQIDLVLDRKDSIVNLCEIKFAKYEYEITKGYRENLANKVKAFQTETKTRKNTHITFISTYGVKQNAHSNAVQSQVVLNDLFG
ncbi:MAG: ATP-binding protein [Lachnospiraceae bacterium]|jgi:AAA+ ATPase superfamily predicted ATPase|nr:ATP-binding protein [Lachnospiraceae bacterium]